MEQENLYILIKNPAQLNRDTLKELQRLIEKYPFFQVGWMLRLKNLKDTGDPAYEEELKKTALRIPDRKQLYRFLHPQTGQYSNHAYFEQSGMKHHDLRQEKDEEKSSSGNLIEKFLSASPGPIKMEKKEQEKEKEETENSVLAKSLTEDDEMITETLANIYVEQRKYDKAQQAFKKLSLKYPEKSIYFASQIDEIEKLKNI